jgi:hypothetical protein
MDRIFHFSYFDPDYQTSGLTVTGLGRVYYNTLYGINRAIPSELDVSAIGKWTL